MNWSSVLFINGILLSSLSIIMAIPLGIEFLVMGTFPLSDFVIPIGCCSFAGISLVLANKKSEPPQIRTTDAFLLTALTWSILPVFAGLPFYFCSALDLSFIDAWFEATSALTATGSTILNNLTILPPGITIWRFILCYIGGAGMVIMGMVIFPILRIGGMHLFRSESSEKSEKIMPSVAQMASWIVFVYSLAIIVCAFFLKISGLSTADALCYAISAVSTCGISPHDGSVAALHNRWSEFIILIGMVFGGSSLLLYIKMWKGDLKILFHDAQFKAYLKVLFVASLIISLLRWRNSDFTILHSFRQGIFNTVSVMTTTGFYNDDYGQWGNFALIFFLIMSLIGGCTGSTSGGIKIFRFQVLFASIKTHILQLRRQYGVFIPQYNNQKITDSTIISVYIFIALYLLAIFLGSFCLSLFDLDFLTSISAIVAAIGNAGPGLGPLVGPHTSMAALALGPKLIIICYMILGRLELLTLLTLLAPSFWKK